jgi:hypothetical protein
MPDDALGIGSSSVAGQQDFTMGGIKEPLIAAFEWSMGGDEHAVFEDANLVGENVNIEHPVGVWCRGRCRDCR